MAFGRKGDVETSTANVQQKCDSGRSVRAKEYNNGTCTVKPDLFNGLGEGGKEPVKPQ